MIDAQQPIPAHTILGILDQVKNKLLGFVLGLQENNVAPENIESQPIIPETVRNLFYVNIYGNRNTVASGENVSQAIQTVKKGDADSLLSFLRELNLDDDDVREIEEAVEAEPDAIDGRFGPRVRSWLGGTIEKLTSGALSAGVHITVSMLTQALNDFYGINQ